MTNPWQGEAQGEEAGQCEDSRKRENVREITGKVTDEAASWATPAGQNARYNAVEAAVGGGGNTATAVVAAAAVEASEGILQPEEQQKKTERQG